MITVSEYLQHLLGQLSLASLGGDQRTAEMAIAYSGDEMLRHFSTPRFKLSEVEMTIPMTVTSAGMEETIFLDSSPSIFGYLVGAQLQQFGNRMGLSAKKGEATAVEPSILGNSYQQLSGPLTSSQFGEVVFQRFREICAARYELPPAGNDAVRFEKELAIAAIELESKLRTRSRVIRTSLSHIGIDPRTEVVRRSGAGFPNLIIKAKVVQEGFRIESVETVDGERRRSIEPY